MKSWTLPVMILLICVWPTGSAFADPGVKAENEPPNWDKPASAAVRAFNIEGKVMAVIAEVQWNREQIEQFQSTEVMKQFFPALVFKTEKSDRMRPVMTATNLPGAKFSIHPAGDDPVEEIKVSALDTARLNPRTTYVIYAAWLYHGDGNPAVELQSLQRYAQPNGTLNDIPQTEDELASVDLKHSGTLDWKWKKLRLPDTYLYPPSYVLDEEATKVKIRSYSTIDSKEALEQFKINAENKVQWLGDDEEVPFAITFEGNVIRENLKEIDREYALNISQIYAAGYPINGDIDPDEEVTVSWFDADIKEIMLLLNIGSDWKFRKFIITEIEGTAQGHELNRIIDDFGVDAVDIGDKNGELPTGIHWLNWRYFK